MSDKHVCADYLKPYMDNLLKKSPNMTYWYVTQ
ncbi:unnamed protein product, partial [Rotaria sp. Silwood2]